MAGTRERTVCVLVPARNEEDNLATCIDSLVQQSEPGFVLGEQWWIVLIDDHSEDGTRAIAERFASQHAGVVLIDAPAWKKERHGFTGKNAALWAGVQTEPAQHAEWLLFTDADTKHEPNSLRRAMVEAERHELALLSYSPRQITTGILQRAIMPLVFSELASVYPPKKINDPSSPKAAANGQFLMVNREVYFEVGGHRAVADQVLEDVALARRFKRRHAIRLRFAPEAVSTRMYRTFPEMWQGWTKNLAFLFGNPVFLAMNRLLDFLLLFGIPLAFFFMPFYSTWQRPVLGLLWVRVLFRYYNRISRSNFPLPDLLLSTIALPVFAAMLIRSWQKISLLKQVQWKGREYSV